MNWLNLRTSRLRDPSFIGSDPVERGTWLCVIAYCVELENGGRIVGARLWKDRQWQQACGVTLKEVMKSERLLKWDSDDLLVWEYPADKEKEVSHKREVAKENGQRGGRPRNQEETHEEPTSVISPNQHPKAEGEGEGNRKEKGIGKEEEPPKPPAPASPSKDGKEDIYPTTEFSVRISDLFKRRTTTKWSDKEITAFKKLVKREVISHESLDAIESYYESERLKGNDGNHRRSLETFLNNFDGELDRANNATTQKPEGEIISFWQSPYAEGFSERFREKLRPLIEP